MMTKSISPTQAQILATAAQHPAVLAEAPPNLPAAARNAVFQSLLRAGLLEEVSAADEEVRRAFRITAAGLAAVGAAASPVEAMGEAATDTRRGRAGQGGAPRSRRRPRSRASRPLPLPFTHHASGRGLGPAAGLGCR